MSVKVYKIPTEAGTHFPGQSLAPSAILRKLRPALEANGVAVREQPLLETCAASKWQPGRKIDGVRNESNTITTLRSIYDELRPVLDDSFAIFLGGDCTILQPILSAMHTRFNDVGLIYMDGDVDLTLPAEAAASISSTGILDSMTFTHLTQREGGLSSMKAPFSSRPDGTPLITASDVVLFGFDPLQPGPDHWVYLLEHGFKAYARPTVRKDPVGCAKAALAWIEERKKHVVLHFDVDVIDCGDFPLGNYPHHAGLAPDEAFAALEVFLASPSVKGLVVTEVNPNNDPDGTMVGRLADAISRGCKKRQESA